MTEEIVAMAMLLGQLAEEDRERVTALSLTAEQELAERLKAGLKPADCKTAFVTAAAWTALAAMEADGGAVESFTAGDLTIRRTESAQRSRELRAQAERVMAPYLEDGGFCFRGVRG